MQGFTNHGALGLTFLVALAGCGSGSGGDGTSAATDTAATDGATTTSSTTTTGTSGGTSTSATGSSGAGSSTGAGSTGGDPKFDVGGGTSTSAGTGGMGDMCKVVDDMDAVGECDKEAPPDSFTADVQWTWAGTAGDIHAIATPLVANLDDDNADGEVDLCDVPDVIVSAYGGGGFQSDGHLYALDGETGTLKWGTTQVINGYSNPALGDIDGDGLVEIVTSVITTEPTTGVLIAFENDGSLKWMSTDTMKVWQKAVALADLDADGNVEILFGEGVFDASGNKLWSAPDDNGAIDIPTAADLNGDGDLEVLHGGRAYNPDGSLYYSSPVGIGHPQVADLDADPEPEVMIAGFNGLSILEHDGTVKYMDLKPTGDTSWWRPAAIHDIDGDLEPEVLASSNDHYTAYEADLSVIWSTMVDDNSGFAAGTAFDFLGKGVAQAMYADEDFLYVFDDLGASLLMSPRTSWTQAENPVVADVDNDGSAEIVVVSNGGQQPLVQVIRDQDERWIQARRIWNQHAYHVTNVREDGTIPVVQPKSWTLLNTFRTQAQIEGGSVCKPTPRG